jgi:hypothetical protein
MRTRRRKSVNECACACLFVRLSAQRCTPHSHSELDQRQGCVATASTGRLLGRRDHSSCDPPSSTHTATAGTQSSQPFTRCMAIVKDTQRQRERKGGETRAREKSVRGEAHREAAHRQAAGSAHPLQFGGRGDGFEGGARALCDARISRRVRLQNLLQQRLALQVRQNRRVLCSTPRRRHKGASESPPRAARDNK